MLRRAVAGDIQGIQKLIESNPETILRRSTEELRELIGCFWVMEEEGEVVGCACLDVYSSKIAEVRTVIVRADRQGLGYGSDLVRAAVTEAKSMHIHEILVVTSFPKYFERLGFGSCLNEKYALFWVGD